MSEVKLFIDTSVENFARQLAKKGAINPVFDTMAEIAVFSAAFAMKQDLSTIEVKDRSNIGDPGIDIGVFDRRGCLPAMSLMAYSYTTDLQVLATENIERQFKIVEGLANAGLNSLKRRLEGSFDKYTLIEAIVLETCDGSGARSRIDSISDF